MAFIETKTLKKTYGSGAQQVEALKGVSVQIQKGEFTAIAGPSGSGKSTLLHLLGGIDTPSSGSILFSDQDISRLTKAERAEFRLNKIGFIFQAYNLLNVLTALENVEYIMLLQKIPARDRRKQAVEMLEKVGLKDYLHRRPMALSGGQQQRVAVARALATKPMLILADEPTANLDSKTALGLMALMKELNKREQVTFVISTHDEQMMKYTSRIIRLKDGNLNHENA